MRALMFRDDATGILVVRGFTMWILVRLVFLAIGMANSESIPLPPAGVVGLSTLLCIGEWRRRREAAFWKNLGVSLRAMLAIATLASLTGEFALIIVRYVLSHR